MADRHITVSCTGCCLADYLYADIDFSRPELQAYLSQRDGDGGIAPGKLVFADSLERFTGQDINEIIALITAGQPADAFNIGGPAIVALAGAAQLLGQANVSCNFYGFVGNDVTGDQLVNLLQQLPVNLEHYHRCQGATANTVVLSDPRLNNGAGERAFINNIGVSSSYSSEKLGTDFFAADILFFGATALVPKLHSNLTELLQRGRQNGCLNIVTTVYDFINEQAAPGQPWPLGKDLSSYRYIDLLLVDYEEAMRLTNQTELTAAVQFFIDHGVGAFAITHGAENITFYSNGKLFRAVSPTALPVCRATDRELAQHPELCGDTTGCGDNFAGGVIFSLLRQLQDKAPGKLDLTQAVSWGAVAGGFTRFYLGGTYFEKYPGEKLAHLQPFYEQYCQDNGL